MYLVATVQSLPAQCSVHVMVTSVVSTEEQGSPFRQMTMTTMNRRLSPEARIQTIQLFPSAIPNGPLVRNISKVRFKLKCM